MHNHVLLECVQDGAAAEEAAHGAQGADELATIPLGGGTPASSPSVASAESGDDWTMVEVRLGCSLHEDKWMTVAR
jgi:hypothetical protein